MSIGPSTSLALPAKPDLEHLKKQAKQLLRDVRAQRGEALQTILAFHPQPGEFSTLRDAQLVLARRYGYADWEQPRNEVELRQLRGWSVVDVLLPISNNLLDLCRMADTERAALLLARNPTVTHLRTPSGNTALHVVSQAKQDDPDVDASIATIELLLKHGADPKAVNNEGKTPAQWYRQLGMDQLADYMAVRCGGD
jgi:hypothetical protein